MGGRHFDLRTALSSAPVQHVKRDRVIAEVEVRLRLDTKVVSPSVREVSIPQAMRERGDWATLLVRVGFKNDARRELDRVRITLLVPDSIELKPLRHQRKPRGPWPLPLGRAGQRA